MNPAIITKLFKKCSISNDLDGTEGDVLRDEQHNKSDTNSDKKGDNMYDDTWTDTTDVQWREWWWWIFGFWFNIADFSASYIWVQLQGGLLAIETG